MPRILGIDVPNNKRIDVGLRSIYGIGPATAIKVLENAGIDADRRGHSLTEEELATIAKAISSTAMREEQMRGGDTILVEGDLRRTITEDLKTPGAEDVTARYREGDRKVEFDGGTYLRPTVVFCRDTGHPLYNREFLCPYASVVEVPQAEMLGQIGPSLVVSAITKDPDFTEELLNSPLIERLNLGPVTTMKVSWDQPHEGNMFEFLYKRRSIERSEALSA